jgi:general nucleoside transport system permease protein
MSAGTITARTAAVTPRQAAWGGIALAGIAAYLALPPLLVRSPIPSLVLAFAAVALGAWAVRGEERRLGGAAVVIGLLAAVGSVAATGADEGKLNDVFVWGALAAAMLRYATPLIFAALGGLVSERSGVVNIALEGMMLSGAFFGAWGADVTGSWIGGLVVAVVAGAAMALIHAIFSVSLKADQIVSGTAINFLAAGVTGLLFVQIYGTEGTPDNLPEIVEVHLPIGSIPFIGEAFAQLSLMVWIALALVPVVGVYLFRTAQGLRHRSVGENPLAADTAGISVTRTRYLAVIASGMLAAMGGAFLSIGFVHSFNQGMSAGKGFIALAAMIAGRWRPGQTLLICLLFGFSSALAQRLPTFSEGAATLFQTLPYVVTLIVVAGLVGRSRPPAADGIPYERH